MMKQFTSALLAVSGDLAYISSGSDGLSILDFPDPASPVVLGSISTIDAWLVKVRGGYACVVEAIPNEPYYLRIIDVSDPSTPFEVGSLQVPTLASELEVSGGYAYIATYYDGVRTIDVSDPSAPFPAAIYNAPDAIDIDVRGDCAYVASADWDGGFLILDVSNPTSPSLLSLYNPTGWFHLFHVAVSGDSAYVSQMNEIFLFDISNPASPVEMESIDVPLEIFDMTAAGRSFSVSDYRTGLRIWDNTLLPATDFFPAMIR